MFGIFDRSRSIPVRSKFVLSYVAIFVVPLVCAGVLAFRWVDSTERAKIREAAERIGESAALSIQTEFDELRRFAVLASESRMMTKLMYMQGDELLLERFSNLTMLSDYIQQFSVYAASRDLVRFLHVVLNTKDVVFTTGTQIGSVGLLAGAMFGQDEESHRRLSDLIAGRHDGSIIYPVRLASRSSQDAMLFLVSLPRERSLPVLCTFIFEIEVGHLLEIVGKSTARGEFSVLLTYNSPEGGDPLPVMHDSSGSRAFGTLPAGPASDRTAASKLSIVDARQTAFPELSIHVVGQKGLLYSELRSMRLALFLILSALLVACLLLTGYFVRSNWKPVRRIVELFSQEHGGSPSRLNEYELIETAVQRLLVRESELESSIERQKERLTKYLLKRIIETRNDGEQLSKAELREIGAEFAHRYTMCVVCMDQDAAGLWGSVIHGLDGKYPARCCTLEYPGYLCVVVSFADEEYRTRLMRAAQAVIENAHSPLRPRLGIGLPYDDVTKMHRSHDEALSVTDYQLAQGENSILVYESVERRRADFYFPLEHELTIANCLKAGDFPGTCAALDRCIDATRDRAGLNADSVATFYHGAYFTCLRIVNELALDLALDRNFHGISRGKSFAEMKRMITDTYGAICTLTASRHSGYAEALRKRITHYIDEHYSDSGISLFTLSEHLSLSTSHVSRLIHKLFRDSFPSLLSRRRIQAAKDLLSGSESTVDYVARTAGFTNTTSLARSFKRIEGITPSQYRSQRANGG